MFAGHLAIALGAKSAAPKIPLWILVAASFGLDLVWPVLLLIGVEVVRVDPGNTAFTPLAFDSYPWTHSLTMVLAWGIVAQIAAQKSMRDRASAWIVGGVVVSHWVLDFVTHRPDLPIWPGGQSVGLGLWNSIPWTLIVEGGMFVIAIAMYLRSSRSLDRTGIWAFWALVLLTGVVWASQPWSPPPPDPTAVAVVTLSLWLFLPWAEWIERHRETLRVA